MSAGEYEVAPEFNAVRRVAPWVLLAVITLAVFGQVNSFRAAAQKLDPKKGASAASTGTAEGPAKKTEAKKPATKKTPAKTEQPKEQVEVIIDGLNFRKSPGSSSGVIRGLDQGEKLTFIETQGRWHHVKDAKGVEGWVAAGSRYTRKVGG